MTTVIAWVVVFGVLVAVHEAGHFTMAKVLGMRVEEFSLGFGPAFIKRRIGETVYAGRMIPLGGYVRLPGMEGTPSKDPRDFPNRPLWERFTVILAGPVMNLLLAAVLYAFVFGPIGVPAPTTTVAQTLPNYPAYSAGIRAGDRIVAIDNVPIRTWSALDHTIRHHAHSTMDITVMRHGRRQTFHVRPRWDATQKAYIVGIQPAPSPTKLVHKPPLQALWAGVLQTILLSARWFMALVHLVTGTSSFDLTGPVGIAVLVGRAVHRGFASLILLSAALSANLGLFNVLPVPVLDGSRLFLLAVEGVRRRAMNPDRENMIHFVGMLVLLVFVVFVTYHDIVHYFHVGSFF